ncbi:MAG: hypothetical protein ACPG8V_04890 [Alphaproteobacteria bacterium]
MIEFISENIPYVDVSIVYAIVFALAFKNRIITSYVFVNILLFVLLYMLIDSVNILFFDSSELFISPFLDEYYISYGILVIAIIRVISSLFKKERRVFGKK